MFLTECSWPQIIAVFIVALTTYILYMIWIRRKYPPGPWPLPIIGNIHRLSGHLHIDLTDLEKEYGPIYTLWIGWNPTVVLSSRQLAKEMLLSKGKDFADRAIPSYMFYSMTHGNEDMGSRPYDEKSKLLRRVAFSFMKAETTHGVSVQGIIENEVEEFLVSLQKMEGMLFDPSSLVTWSNINVVMLISASKRFKDVSDPEYVNWMKALSLLDKALSSVIDLFPKIAGILPWSRKAAKEFTSIVDPFLECIVSERESTYEDGKVRDLIDVLIKTHRELHNDATSSSVQLTKIDYMLFILAVAIGGAESPILWSITVLLRQPEIQRKLHRELDNYVSTIINKRQEDKKDARVLITLSDRPHLPYLNAFIYEVLRRCVIVPASFEHKAVRDTFISCYRIPKNTTVIANIYAIHMSHQDWDNPEVFKPERFLDGKQELDVEVPKKLVTFSAGPRSCVGQNLIKIKLFIYLANLLLNYELKCPSIDAVPSFNDVIQGLNFIPKPFLMDVKDRRK